VPASRSAIKKTDCKKQKGCDRTIRVGTNPWISGMNFESLSELFRQVTDPRSPQTFVHSERVLCAVTEKLVRTDSFDNWDLEKSNSESFCELFTLPSKLSRRSSVHIYYQTIDEDEKSTSMVT
jgi:hypothetical protein